jgi:hypothetical protein
MPIATRGDSDPPFRPTLATKRLIEQQRASELAMANVANVAKPERRARQLGVYLIGEKPASSRVRRDSLEAAQRRRHLGGCLAIRSA